MLISYEDFKKRVPKDTLEFIKKIVPKLEKYLNKSFTLKYTDKGKTTIEVTRYLIATDELYRTNEIIRGLLNKYKYRDNQQFDFTKLKESEEQIETIFSNHSYLFEKIDNIEDLYALSTYDILNTLYNNFSNNSENTDTLEVMFEELNNAKKFVSELESHMENVKKEKIEELKKSFYKDMPIETIKYLETVNKIHKSLNANNNSKVISTQSDMTVFSLLTGLSIVDNSVKYLIENEKVSYDDYKDFCNSDLLFQRIQDHYDASIVMMIEYYYKYLNSGLNKDVDSKDLTIEKIAANLFDRKLNDSLLLDRIVNHCDSSFENFKNLEVKAKKYNDIFVQKKTLDKLKEFYKELPLESISLLEKSSKIYYLLNVQKEQNKNERILTKNDLQVVSVFLSMYFTKNNDLVKFYNAHGMNLNNVLEYLGVNINSEMLSKTSVKYGLIEQNFEKFINNGENSSRRSEYITAKYIFENIFDRDFTNSLVIEKMFVKFDIEFESGKKHNAKVEKFAKELKVKNDRKLSEKFFRDMDPETIKFIENISKAYNYISRLNYDVIKEHSVDDLIEYSILYAFIEHDDEDNKEFIDSRLNYNELFNFLSISTPNYRGNPINDYSVDINFIANRIAKYIFGGYNKELDRKDITPSNIIRNVFNKSLNNSMIIKKHLHRVKSDFYDIENYDEAKKEYYNEKKLKLKKEQEAKEEEYKKSFCKVLNEEMFKHLKYVCNLRKHINEHIESYEGAFKYDINALTFVVSALKNDSEVKTFMEQRGISLETCLKEAGLNEEEITSIDDTEDMEYASQSFGEFLNSRNLIESYNDFYKKIIDYLNSYDDIRIKECLKDFGAGNDSEVEKLLEEISTGKKVVEPLTREEQLCEFNKGELPEINLNQITSISNFGNGLAEQSNFISKEFSSIIKSNKDYMEGIEDLEGKLSVIKPTETPVKKGLFGMFSDETTVVNERPNMESAEVVLSELEDFLIEKEERLGEGIDNYQFLKHAIGQYLLKLKQMLTKLESNAEELKEEIKNKEYGPFDFSENDDKLRLELLEDKINDFKVSTIVMMQEYTKVGLMMGTHAKVKQKVSHARGTLLPAYRIEVSVNEGIELQRESMSTIKDITSSLQSLSQSNVDELSSNVIDLKASVTALFDDSTYKQLENIFDREGLTTPEEIQKRLVKN